MLCKENLQIWGWVLVRISLQGYWKLFMGSTWTIYVTTLFPFIESLSCRTLWKGNKVEFLNVKMGICHLNKLWIMIWERQLSVLWLGLGVANQQKTTTLRSNQLKLETIWGVTTPPNCSKTLKIYRASMILLHELHHSSMCCTKVMPLLSQHYETLLYMNPY